MLFYILRMHNRIKFWQNSSLLSSSFFLEFLIIKNCTVYKKNTFLGHFLPALKPEQHQSVQLSLGYHLLLPHRMSQKNMMFPYWQDSACSEHYILPDWSTDPIPARIGKSKNITHIKKNYQNVFRLYISQDTYILTPL